MRPEPGCSISRAASCRGRARCGALAPAARAPFTAPCPARESADRSSAPASASCRTSIGEADLKNATFLAAMFAAAATLAGQHRGRSVRRGARSGLPVQERRRADQRHRHGVRRERPLRAGPAAGRLHRLRGRRAAGRSPTSAPSACRSASASCSTRAAAWPARKSRPRASALDRFLYDLLDNDDEIFLYRFSNVPVLLQGLDARIARRCRARSAASPRTAAPRCTTRSPRRFRWRSRDSNQKKALLRDLRRQRHREPHRACAT